ncbi:MAG: TPM domain-containing protein [Clostridium sp.]|nr:TPM domain-containing protein [Clostridium sp.]
MKKIRFIAALLCLVLVNVIPVSATEEVSLPKVVDNADLLSDAEETELTTLVNDIATVYQIDVVLVTENQRQEADIQAEADMLFDSNGYGIGDKKNGVLFVLDMGNREWAISTHGDAIMLFSDYDLNSLGQTAAQNYFANGQYRDGFVTYVAGIVRICEKKLNSQGNEQNAGDESTEANGTAAAEADDTEDAMDEVEKNQAPNSGIADTDQTQTGMEPPSEPASPTDYLYPAFLGALIITIIYMVSMKKGMKKARKQQNADVYQSRDASMQIRKSDVFLTTSITKTPVKQKDPDPPRRPDPPRDSDSQRYSRTTTTVHTSDNGETHGGASGKF